MTNEREQQLRDQLDELIAESDDVDAHWIEVGIAAVKRGLEERRECRGAVH